MQGILQGQSNCFNVATLPPQVTNLVLSQSPGTIAGSFNGVDAAWPGLVTRYRIVYKAGGMPVDVYDGDAINVQPQGLPIYTFTISGLSNGVSYGVRVFVRGPEGFQTSEIAQGTITPQSELVLYESGTFYVNHSDTTSGYPTIQYNAGNIYMRCYSFGAGSTAETSTATLNFTDITGNWSKINVLCDYELMAYRANRNGSANARLTIGGDAVINLTPSSGSSLSDSNTNYIFTVTPSGAITSMAITCYSYTRVTDSNQAQSEITIYKVWLEP